MAESPMVRVKNGHDIVVVAPNESYDTDVYIEAKADGTELTLLLTPKKARKLARAIKAAAKSARSNARSGR